MIFHPAFHPVLQVVFIVKKDFSTPQFLSNVWKQKSMRDGCFKKSGSIFVKESSSLQVEF